MRAAFLIFNVSCLAVSASWIRHTIDDTSAGADGVRLADINQDGRLDVATGWEEGGVIRVYLHPGAEQVRQPWPRVTVGEVASVEDAVLVDLDGNGVMDVVSSCEGRTRSVFYHWSPPVSDFFDESAWITEAVPAAEQVELWMYALPLQVDHFDGPDLVVGSKGTNATVSLLIAPPDARQVDRWKRIPIYQAGWIMSLIAQDMDGDGDLDIVVSDRKGKRRGVLWLENPGPDKATEAGSWVERRVGAAEREVMFMDLADWNEDGRVDVLAAVKPRSILLIEQPSGIHDEWEEREWQLPDRIGTAKAVKAVDVNSDGRLDLVFSCEAADGDRSGIVWLEFQAAGAEFQMHDLSGPEGIKFDRLEVVDVDGDGDLDVMTCEERTGLGVIWYENPF